MRKRPEERSAHTSAPRRTAGPRLRRRRRFGGAGGRILSQISLDPGNFTSPTKKPHETPWGFRHRSFSRRARPYAAWKGGLAYGFSADHSGGTAADSHSLPRFLCLQIEFRVYAAPDGVLMHDRACTPAKGLTEEM